MSHDRSRSWFIKPVGQKNNRIVHTLIFFFLSISDMKVFVLIFALCIAVSSGYMGGYYQDRYYPRYYGNSLYDDDYGKYFQNYKWLLFKLTAVVAQFIWNCTLYYPIWKSCSIYVGQNQVWLRNKNNFRLGLLTRWHKSVLRMPEGNKCALKCKLYEQLLFSDENIQLSMRNSFN